MMKSLMEWDLHVDGNDCACACISERDGERNDDVAYYIQRL